LSETAAIILAAGMSTRMKSDLPKVLHEVCGRPMLAFVVSAARLAGADRLLVVVGHGKDQVMARFASDGEITWVEQPEQNGTGGAVACCQEALVDFVGSVLVIAGDMPLIRRETLADLKERRERSKDALTLATTRLEDPTGYGRIVRDAEGQIEAIVEDRDCTAKQRRIKEVNPSYYCFDAERLFDAIDQIEPSASGKEVYITDAVRTLREAGYGVSAPVSVPVEDALGINSRLDLARIGRVMQDRIQLNVMSDGATIVDPDNTWIEADVSVGRETTIHPFSFIGAGATIGEGCRIGPCAMVASGEVVDDGAVVGPAGLHGVGAS
jgi:bifunctional UDP-N-acetylglucosamine pyrophosphorylase/glucosamine-1-phosphate N-acetyltransferase